MASKKIREKAEMKWFEIWCGDVGYKPDLVTGLRAYDLLVEHFCPDVVRSDADVMQDAIDQIRERLNILEEGMTVNVDEAMRFGGLDPSIRSDRRAVRQFLNESGALEHHKSEPEKWVKRLTDQTPKNGAGNGVDDDETRVPGEGESSPSAPGADD